MARPPVIDRATLDVMALTYADGASLGDLEALFKVGRTTIWNSFRRHGIPLRRRRGGAKKEAQPVKETYAVGDPAWIYPPNHQGALSAGVVVHKFTLPDPRAAIEHYVIEIATPIDPLYEVRDALSMSDTAAGPIGLWRRLRLRRADYGWDLPDD